MDGEALLQNSKHLIDQWGIVMQGYISMMVQCAITKGNRRLYHKDCVSKPLKLNIGTSWGDSGPLQWEVGQWVIVMFQWNIVMFQQSIIMWLWVTVEEQYNTVIGNRTLVNFYKRMGHHHETLDLYDRKINNWYGKVNYLDGPFNIL